VDSEAPSQRSGEAMGAARVQGAAETWGQSRLGMEHGKVRPWSLAPSAESCSGHGLAGQPWRWFGSAEAVPQGSLSTEPPWYVIRMPGGVGGGRPRGPSLSRLTSRSAGESFLKSLVLKYIKLIALLLALAWLARHSNWKPAVTVMVAFGASPCYTGAGGRVALRTFRCAWLGIPMRHPQVASATDIALGHPT
jgi:hypothetical protein